MFKRKLEDANAANTSIMYKNDSDVNKEDDVIKFYLMPSLQHISMSKMIITLWNHTDSKYQLLKRWSKVEDVGELFCKIKNEVLKKVLHLPVPNSYKEVLSEIVAPIDKEILDWINYQDKCIFDIHSGQKSMAIKFIDYLVWTSRGVIDYKETAKTLLAEEEKLSGFHKYNIACAYCLEDYISNQAPQAIVAPLSSIEYQTMTYFWNARITGDFTALENRYLLYRSSLEFDRCNVSLFEFLFRLLLCNDSNQIAIKYLWDQLSDFEKSKQLVSAIKITTNMDLKCFFLSQINKVQEKEVFEYIQQSYILSRFLDDWLWGHYFLRVVQHIVHLLSGDDYMYVLRLITFKMEKKSTKYKEWESIFKKVWQYAPQTLRDNIYKKSYFQLIFFSLVSMKSIDIIQPILADMNDVRKKEIIFSNQGLYHCKIFITSNEWDLIHMLIENCLSSKENVECFKKALMKQEGVDIAQHFVQNIEWTKAEQFLQWAGNSGDDIKEYKSKCLSNTTINSKIWKSIVEQDKGDFSELEKFFDWCSSGDEKSTVKHKAKIPVVYFKWLICEAIVNDKYELLEKILNWCFVNDQKQITQFKQRIYEDSDKYFIFEFINLIVNLIRQDKQLQSLKKFVNYWCATEEEISKFKAFILTTKHGQEVCMSLLIDDMWELADEFVNWCSDSSQLKIRTFKNLLMIHDWMYFYLDVGDPRTLYETKVFKWFNPSIATVIRFKEKFKHCRWFEYVLPALDDYIKEQECCQDESIQNDVNYTLQDLISIVARTDYAIVNKKV